MNHIKNQTMNQIMNQTINQLKKQKRNHLGFIEDLKEATVLNNKSTASRYDKNKFINKFNKNYH